MKSGGASAKGAQWERQVCVVFSKWISKGEREDLFWRTAMSGGRATVAMKGGKLNKSQVGDICAIDPTGQWLMDNFVIEIKFYKSLEILGSIINNRGTLYTFWKELIQRAEAVGKIPLLIARQNNYPPLLITSLLGEELLGLNTSQKNRGPAFDTHCIARLYRWRDKPMLYFLDGLNKAPYLGK